MAENIFRISPEAEAEAARRMTLNLQLYDLIEDNSKQLIDLLNSGPKDGSRFQIKHRCKQCKDLLQKASRLSRLDISSETFYPTLPQEDCLSAGDDGEELENMVYRWAGLRRGNEV